MKVKIDELEINSTIKNIRDMMYMGVNDVRQTEIHIAEPLVPEPSASESECLLKSKKDTNH